MKQMLHNKKALVGVAILLLFVLVGLAAPLIAPGDPLDFAALPNQPPSAEHWLGTTGQGQDIFGLHLAPARAPEPRPCSTRAWRWPASFGSPTR